MENDSTTLGEVKTLDSSWARNCCSYLILRLSVTEWLRNWFSNWKSCSKDQNSRPISPAQAFARSSGYDLADEDVYEKRLGQALSMICEASEGVEALQDGHLAGLRLLVLGRHNLDTIKKGTRRFRTILRRKCRW